MLLKKLTAAVITESTGRLVTADDVGKIAQQASRANNSVGNAAVMLLKPNYDDGLKKHSFAASFGHSPRSTGVEPGFKEYTHRGTDATQASGVHAVARGRPKGQL